MWIAKLQVDPLPRLVGTNDEALLFLIERDLLDNSCGSIEALWQLPEPQKILSYQQPNGSWLYKGKRPGDEFGEAYELLETWKILRKLVEMYGFDNSHPLINRACEYMLSYQTQEGDIRGILSNQYMPYYMGAILEILIKAGYEKDNRVEKGMQWLLNNRQVDGGWIAPILLFNMRDYLQNLYSTPCAASKRSAFFSYGIRNGHSGFCCPPGVSKITNGQSGRKSAKKQVL